MNGVRLCRRPIESLNLDGEVLPVDFTISEFAAGGLGMGSRIQRSF